MHSDLDRLALRMGLVDSMAAKAKADSEKLKAGSEEYAEALRKHADGLGKHIRKAGVGSDPATEREYCQTLMHRRRMLQTYELSHNDTQRMPDIGAKVKKGIQSVPLSPDPALYLIAHCSTDHNERGDRVTGWQNIPLSEQGEREARELAVALMPSRIEALASSDLQRANQTAEIIAEVTGVPRATPSEGFRPWNLGAFEGQEEELVGLAVRRYVTEHPDWVVPGGESFDTYHGRFMTALMPLLILVGRGLRHSLGVVTHTRGLSLALAWLKSGGKVGSFDAETYLKNDVVPGTILRMSFTEDGWEGELLFPDREEGIPGEVIEKARRSKAQPGQLGFEFDEEKHPRETAGAWQTVDRQEPGWSGVWTFYVRDEG